MSRFFREVRTIAKETYSVTPVHAVIMLRQSPDWRKLDYRYLDSLSPFERQAGLPIGFVRRLVVLWDQAFRIPYFQVRHHLKDLTMRNLASVEDAVLYSIEESGCAVPSARLYLFTDDDDWFSPDIVARLVVQDAPGVEGMIWQSVRLAGTIDVRQVRHCFTNNYCVTSDFIGTREPESRLQSVLQHFDANKLLLDIGFKGVFLEWPLSIANKHPCSPARLFNEYGKELTVDILRKDAERFVSGISSGKLPEETAWARRYVDELWELFLEALS